MKDVTNLSISIPLDSFRLLEAFKHLNIREEDRKIGQHVPKKRENVSGLVTGHSAEKWKNDRGRKSPFWQSL